MSENNIQTTENKLTLKEIWLPLLLSVTTIIGIGVGMKLKNEPLATTSIKKKNAKSDGEEIVGQGRMEEILRYIDAKYVDDVSNKALVDNSVNNLLQELDPHSVYIPFDEIKNVNEDLEGEFEGIGIETIILDDTINIISPLINSPAATTGIMSGDKIISIGDSLAVGKNKRWLNNKLRGKKGTTIKLAIKRDNESRLKTFTITRDKVPVHSVEIASILDDKTGYIKISRFSTNTSKEFIQGLEKIFENKGIKDVVIDLRQNPGGYLDKAVDVLSQLFADKDKLLVYTKGRTVHRNEYKTSGRSRFNVEKVAILIDEGSASASEIVAGAIQDWDRGVIIGRRSFGKGLVQEPYTLKDGSELRLTVARYYTPTGRSIQKPYKNKTKKEYSNEEDKRFERGELTTSDSIQQTDTARFYTASGRLVYGGGGIQPDFFVPIDPLSKNDYFNQLRPWFHEYAYRYYSMYKRDIKFSEWRDYQRTFKISDFAFNDFIKYTEKQGVQKQNNEIPTIREAIRKQIKARIARLLFGDEGYYGILNDNDPMINEALNVLKQKDPLGIKRIVRK